MSRSNSANGARLLVFVLLAAAWWLAMPRQAGAQDPPGRVARMNFIQGSVSMQPAGTQDWFDAHPNRPLTTGDSLWSGDNGRGELHMGSTSMRVSNDTGISFLNLDDQAVQIQLAQGTLNVRLRQLGDTENYEVDTPNLAFTLLRPGEYRISVDPDGNTTAITIRSGAGEVTGGGSAYALDAGQQGIFSGTSPLSYDNEYAPPYDDFDNWCVARDRREEQSRSARYISREVIGYEDLDEYGTWRVDPVYGNVWVPSSLAVGWAPYHHGHWAYVAPWGWTWVDDQPWGFAPFHYGRWAYASGAWLWVPGSVAVVVGHPYVRPMYAPALVAFVGGGGFSVSIGLGGGVAGMAWFPLGPRDVWVPSYHCSPAYVQNVNISNSTVINRTQITTVYNIHVTNVTNVTNITYMNQNAPGAVTAVSKEAFTSGRPVAAAAVKITPQQIQHPQVVERTTPPAPKNLMPATAVRSSTAPPAALANRSVVTKMKPAPQVVPIGHKEPIARSNLVKSAPPAPAAKKLPPPSPATRPAVAPAPGRPAPAVKPAPAPPPKVTAPPPSKAVMPPTKVTTPPKAVTPPPSKTTTPPTRTFTPPPSKAVTTPPPSKTTTPPTRTFTPPPSKTAAPPPKTTTQPASKTVKPPPSKSTKEESTKKKPEPEHP